MDVEFTNGTPDAECDGELVEFVGDVAREHGVTVRRDSGDVLGGSEDATRLVKRVQEHGGTATYVGVGAGNEYGHHTARFDIDEETIPLAVDLLVDSITTAAASDDY